MRNFIDRYRKRRALRMARRGVALVFAAIQSTHLPRSTRRRIMHAMAKGTVSPEAIFGKE